jgi:hypothetical protein
MRKRIICSALLFLFTYAPLSLPANSWAGVVIIFKGSTLVEDTMAGLISIPSMEIQVTCWGVAYSSDDLLVYEPSMWTCSLYEDSLVLTLPDPDGPIILSDGTTGTLREVLEDEPFVIFDTDMGMGTVEVMNYSAGTFPSGGNGGGNGGGGDTIPPNTTITSGPSGTLTNNDVTITYTGTDNTTFTSNLVYSYRLDSYDTSWSGYTALTSKSYNDLPNGSYTFQVRAKDQAGNVDPTPASGSFTVNYTSLKKGDINTDGNVDLADAVLALQVCAGMSPQNVNKQHAIDGGGKVGLKEVIYVLQKVAGLRQ